MSKALEFTVPFLAETAEIRVDPWGISHIKAASRHDVFFAQGFNAARDRLWQIDVWRKRGLGRLAADYGPGFLAQDRACRLFLYRGDEAAELAAYGTPDARSITEAFTAGINAYIDLALADPGLLPPEFAKTDTKPEKWDAFDVVRIRSHGLVRNVLSEAARARILARADLQTDLARRSIEPAHDIAIPDGFDPACVPDDVLDLFRLATGAVDFSPERGASSLDDAWRWTKVTDQGDVYLQGSNNWVVAGSRTDTGRPILASDPHRAHSLPSLRQIVHLTTPDLDVIGAGEPALPGLCIGHNDHAAFGLTIFPMDQEDLIVLETHPDDPNLFRWQDGWERMEVVHETIAVRGHPDQTVEMKFTRHGPVVCEKPGLAFAVRSVWFTPGGSAYFASLSYLDARSPQQFEQALAHWASPSVNQVYADRDGNIGWYVAGFSPVRPNWDGLLPVPGDGRYEWAGFTDFSHLPKSLNPEKGYFATANEMNLPDGYDNETHKLGFEWAEHSRSNRIHQVLDGENRHTLAASMALQTDDHSIPAARLGRLIATLPGRPAALLQGWNHRLDRHSPAAALQEVWWSKHLKPALFDAVTKDAEIRKLLAPGDTETLLALLEDADPRLGDIQALLARTLDAAFADCASRMGDDPSLWAWGRLHHGAFPHPLGRITDLAGVERVAKGGSGSTVMNAGYRLSDFKVTHGASFRMVLDVGNWDASVAINAPGQSGDPRSAHYGDLATKWAEGAYVPLLYSNEAVEAATIRRYVLRPA